MSDARLPSHLEITGLIRAAEAAGGFATVVQAGERDSGTILLLTMHRGADMCLWERLPRLDGVRRFSVVRRRGGEEDAGQFEAYLARRGKSDPDAWVLELDVADAERFVVESIG